MDYNENLYQKSLENIISGMNNAEGYELYKTDKTKLSLEQQQNMPMALAKYAQSLNPMIFSDQDIKSIIETEGMEKLAEYAGTIIEKYLYDDNQKIQKRFVPLFKDRVEDSKIPHESIDILLETLKKNALELPEAIPDELKDYVTIATSDESAEGSEEYLAAKEGIVDAYIDELHKQAYGDRNDEEIEDSKSLLKEYQMLTFKSTKESMMKKYALANIDKIQELNGSLAEKVIEMDDNKKKLGVILRYDAVYENVLNQYKKAEA